MSRNRSLDEFLPDEGDAAVDDVEGSVDPDAERADGADAEESAAPNSEYAAESDADSPSPSDAADASPTDTPGEGDAVDPGPANVDPIESTARWTPGGAACDACGASVERRWRDGDGFVCADCKEW